MFYNFHSKTPLIRPKVYSSEVDLSHTVLLAGCLEITFQISVAGNACVFLFVVFRNESRMLKPLKNCATSTLNRGSIKTQFFF